MSRTPHYGFKFVIMDFEFSTFDRTKLVLISGAMSNSWDDSSVVKLEGRPLLLTDEYRIRVLTDFEVRRTIKDIRRVFRYKPDRLQPLMAQLFQSLNTDCATLTAGEINKYIRKDRKNAVIVLWSGTTDRTILDRLRISNYAVLNIIAHDTWKNKQFDLKLINMNDDELIFSTYIGTYEKNGRQLSLTETHSMTCSKHHDVTYAHDPCTDVTLTKCIFNTIVQKFSYANLIGYLRHIE